MNLPSSHMFEQDTWTPLWGANIAYLESPPSNLRIYGISNPQFLGKFSCPFFNLNLWWIALNLNKRAPRILLCSHELLRHDKKKESNYCLKAGWNAGLNFTRHAERHLQAPPPSLVNHLLTAFLVLCWHTIWIRQTRHEVIIKLNILPVPDSLYKTPPPLLSGSLRTLMFPSLCPWPLKTENIMKQ